MKEDGEHRHMFISSLHTKKEKFQIEVSDESTNNLILDFDARNSVNSNIANNDNLANLDINHTAKSIYLSTKMRDNQFLKSFQKITLKDIDFENLVFKRKLKLAISCKDVKLIVQTIKRDVDFLKENKLMDYSVLLGIETINETP